MELKLQALEKAGNGLGVLDHPEEEERQVIKGSKKEVSGPGEMAQ